MEAFLCDLFDCCCSSCCRECCHTIHNFSELKLLLFFNQNPDLQKIVLPRIFHKFDEGKNAFSQFFYSFTMPIARKNSKREYTKSQLNYKFI